MQAESFEQLGRLLTFGTSDSSFGAGRGCGGW